MLSGPSCVGKGPLHNALKRFYPELEKELEKLVLFNSRQPRPGEQDGVDYHFRSRSVIEALREKGDFIVLDVRGDLQALDVKNLLDILEGEKNAFFEGNPFVPLEALRSPQLTEISKLSIFLTPLSKEEILHLQDPERRVSLPEFITDVMRRKLLRRTSKQKGILSMKDLENIERRANHFDYVLPTHDGEDSENWNAFYYPIGDARRALLAFAAILSGHESAYAEKWEQGLLP
jgi:guanylate kinase